MISINSRLFKNTMRYLGILFHRCELCGRTASLYTYPDGGVSWLCKKHAVSFCKFCKRFFGGVESFEFSENDHGLCEECGEYIYSEDEEEVVEYELSY